MKYFAARNGTIFLLIMTSANLGASYMTLQAARTEMNVIQPKMQQVETALKRLDEITTNICAQQGITCTQNAKNDEHLKTLPGTQSGAQARHTRKFI